MKKTIAFFKTTFLLASLVFVSVQLNATSCAEASSVPISFTGTDMSIAIPEPASDKLTQPDYDWSMCSGFSSSYSGVDTLFRLDMGVIKNITITITDLTDDLDLFVFRSCDDGGGVQLDSCVGLSIRSSTLDDFVNINSANGTYYIAVDGYQAGRASSFTLNIECDDTVVTPPPPTPGPTTDCTSFTSISCGQKITASNSSSDYRSSDDFGNHINCSGWSKSYSGREVVFKLKAGSYGLSDVTIDLHSLGYGDHDMFIYGACSSTTDPWDPWGPGITTLSGSVGYCHSTSNSYGSKESAFINYISPWDEVYIVIEGAPTSSYSSSYYTGSFELVVSCGDPCDQFVQTVECGDNISSTTTSAWNKSSYYSCDSYNIHGNNWGPEKTYKLKVDQQASMKIDLNVHSGADLNLYLLNTCDAKSCIASSKKLGSGVDEKIHKTLYPGTYYIVVDGFQGDAGKFDLSISGCASTSCSTNDRLYCDQKKYGSTSGHSNKVPVTKCGGYSGINLPGRDRIYKFKATKSQEYTFRLTGLSKNLDLFLLDNCNNATSCFEKSTNSGSSSESITTYLSKNEEIHVLVDSKWSSTSGGFYIEVECADEPHYPDDDDDDDEPQDPTDDDDDDTDPDDEACFTYSYQADGSISIDLSDVLKESCSTAQQTLTAYPVDDSGNSDYTSPMSIPITGNSASFSPGSTLENATYEICFIRACGTTFSCCVDVEFEASLACGDSFDGTTIGKSSSFDKNDFQACYYSGSSFNGPDDLVKFTKSSADEVVTLTLFQETSNLSLFILDHTKNTANDECKGLNFMASKQIGNSGAVGEFWTDEDDPLPAGQYYALIEGYASSIASDYSLSITCGLDCTSATSIQCNETLEDQNTDDGENNESAYDTDDGLFVGYTGNERIFELVLDSAANITVTLSDIASNNGAIDLDLFILSDSCHSGEVIALSISDGNEDEVAQAVLEAGTYYIVVDGYRGASGTFNLSVEGCELPNDPSEDLLAASNRSLTPESLNNEFIISEVFPNPFSEHVMFDVLSSKDQIVKLDIIAVNGQILYSREHGVASGNTQIRINSSELSQSSGVLYFRILSENEVIRGKLMKLKN